MIEIIQISADYDSVFALVIEIDGVGYSTSMRDFVAETGHGQLMLTVQNPAFSRALLKHSFKSIPPKISRINFPDVVSLKNDEVFFSVSAFQNNDGVCSLEFTFEKSPEWRLRWSFGTYTEMAIALAIINAPGIVRTGFSKSITFNSSFEPIRDLETFSLQITECTRHLQTIHEDTVRVLAQETDSMSLRMLFTFPDEIKTSCKQYLLYFSEFLRDLGLEVKTSLSEEVGNVLFRVTPDSKEVAMDAIKKALDIYLQLPNQDFEEGKNRSIAIEKLESAIYRLRSDLKLASAELQAKNATIQAHELTIGMQRALIGGRLLPQPTEKPDISIQAKEDLIPGLLSLGIYEEKGVHVNLGEVLRRVKALFKKKEAL